MHMLLLLIQIKYAIKEVIITALSFSFSCIHFHKLLFRSTTFTGLALTNSKADDTRSNFFLATLLGHFSIGNG